MLRVFVTMPSTYLAVELHLWCFPSNCEERHHSTMYVVCEVAVEQPGAGVVCVGVKHHEAAGLDHGLVHVVTIVVKDDAMPVSGVDGIFTAQGAHIPANPEGKVKQQ